jgi:hypothetical protein
MPARTSHDHRIWSARCVAAVLGAIAAFAVIPALASAAVVSSNGTTVTFQALPGETNVVNLSETDTDYRFNDTGTALTVGAGCAQVDANTVDCPKGPPTSVLMNMGDMGDVIGDPFAPFVDEDPFTINGEAGDDDLRATAAGDTVNGGDGDDDLRAQPGNDTVNGGNDDDYVFGGLGDDDLHGNLGNDRLEGYPGADAFDGDAGIDRVLYGGSENPCEQAIVVTIDNTANDTGCRTTGGADTGDNLANTIESITGSHFGDAITGSCFANTFAGDPGTTNNDVGGNDVLNGDPAAGCNPGSPDFMGGGEGNDTFNGDGLINATHLRGFDTVTYGIPYTGVGALNITLNDLGDDTDGFGNSLENVNGDVERVIGGGAFDVINATGADQAVQLFGRLGNDTLTDGPFDDLLDGEGGGTDTANCVNGGVDTRRNIEVNNGCEIAG